MRGCKSTPGNRGGAIGLRHKLAPEPKSKGFWLRPQREGLGLQFTHMLLGIERHPELLDKLFLRF